MNAVITCNIVMNLWTATNTTGS